MWREVRGYMTRKYGAMDNSGLRNAGRINTREEWLETHRKWRLGNAKGWLERAWTNMERVREGKTGKKTESLVQEIEAILEILTRTAENDWFEYPAGSRLLYFCFPQRYRLQARAGVKVWYNEMGPTSKEPQPPLRPDEREVLRRKITKFINRGYIAPTPGCRSVIKYFAVPKGVVDDVVQDWRVVFKLNDAVFVPLFSLPTVNSLLWLVDRKTVMSDWDMGDMFHNFQLHENTVKATEIDLRPLELDKK
jgi:hypothetical protein